MFVQEMEGRTNCSSFMIELLHAAMGYRSWAILIGLAWSQTNHVFESTKLRQVPKM